MSADAIWITWENQTRNHSMSTKLGVPLYELISPNTGIRRYLELMWRTFQLIRKHRPSVVFCQNPSIVLAFFCTFLFQTKHRKVVVDEHNAGLFPLEGKSAALNFLANYVVRHADLLIVSNENLSQHCERIGGKAVVIPDPLPDLTNYEQAADPAPPFQILFICGWGDDEPVEAVFEACKSLFPGEFKVVTTMSLHPSN